MNKILEEVQEKADLYLDEKYNVDDGFDTKKLREIGNSISVGLVDSYVQGYKQAMKDLFKEVQGRYNYLEDFIVK
jgi:hypothetical protein